MTPRIDVSISSLSGGIDAGETLSFSVKTECLSPRLGSKESIYILDAASSVLDTTIAVGAAQTLTNPAEILLAEDLTDSGFSILVGNNYTGFAEFVISLGTPGISIDPILVGAVIGIAIGVIVLTVYFVKFR